jgi:hypothetical protein
MMRRRFLTVTLASMAAIGLGATGASAGEMRGNGEPKAVNGNSICAYSGQNDGYHDSALAESPEDAAQRVQSFGQEVRKFAALGLVNQFATGQIDIGVPGVNGVGIPGAECNGHLNPWPPTP